MLNFIQNFEIISGFNFSAGTMVLISDVNSEHVAHEWRKNGLFYHFKFARTFDLKKTRLKQIKLPISLYTGAPIPELPFNMSTTAGTQKSIYDFIHIPFMFQPKLSYLWPFLWLYKFSAPLATEETVCVCECIRVAGLVTGDYFSGSGPGLSYDWTRIWFIMVGSGSGVWSTVGSGCGLLITVVTEFFMVGFRIPSSRGLDPGNLHPDSNLY